MSISIIIDDANIDEYVGDHGSTWLVKHPCNGAILAYCSTRDEAETVRDELNALTKRLEAIVLAVEHDKVPVPESAKR